MTVDLALLPPQILLETLKKMPNIPLCRLRGTCSVMEDFVYSHKKAIGKRTRTGLSITFTNSVPGEISVNKMMKSVIPHVSGMNHIMLKTSDVVAFNVSENFERRTTGIAVEMMHVDFEKFVDHSNEVLDKLIDCVKVLPPCYLASIKMVDNKLNAEKLHLLLDSINFVKYLSVTIRNNTEEYLKMLNQTKRRNHIQVAISSFNSVLSGPFELLRNFLDVTTFINAVPFYTLLWDMHRAAKGPISLRLLECVFYNYNGTIHPIEEANRSLPPFNVLWKVDPDDSRFEELPTSIRSLDFIHNPSKTVLICEYLNRKDRTTDIHFWFYDKTCELLDRVLSLLKFSDFSKKKEYLETPEELRVHLLRDACLEKFNARWPLGWVQVAPAKNTTTHTVS